MADRESIKALFHDELATAVEHMGLPKFRTSQIEQWLWSKGARSFEEMTNLSKALRQQLDERFHIDTLECMTTQYSVDGTRKYLFRMGDEYMVEAVGIPSHGDTRLTVCFSTQAGCPMGCVFCATGRSGFTRNLNIGEMFDQVRLVGEDFGIRVSNIVAMGQGEPFLNYEAVLAALRLFNDSKVGLGVGARHITVSTCGIVDGISMLSEQPEQFTLALSLHSALQQTRDALMPGARKYPLSLLRETLVSYCEATSRRPSFEYALIDGVNDDDEHLFALRDFCNGLLCHVNLIPLNPVNEDSDEHSFRPSGRMSDFYDYLNGCGIETTIRESRGADIDGACGQLRQQFGN